MIEGLIVLMIVALFATFCIRHFFIQMLALKLFVDAVILIFLAQSREPIASNYLAVTWILGALVGFVLFVFSTAAIMRFGRTKSLDLGDSNE
mgnify:CR=1 FL=1